MIKQNEVHILIAGDFCPNDRVETLLGTQNQEEILKELSYLSQQCDLSIVNLECPLTTGDVVPIVKCGPNLKSRTEAVQLLKNAGFSLVTLANNHIRDYGEDGIEQTIATLEKSGIDYAGGGQKVFSH